MAAQARAFWLLTEGRFDTGLLVCAFGLMSRMLICPFWYCSRTYAQRCASVSKAAKRLLELQIRNAYHGNELIYGDCEAILQHSLPRLFEQFLRQLHHVPAFITEPAMRYRSEAIVRYEYSHVHRSSFLRSANSAIIDRQTFTLQCFNNADFVGGASNSGKASDYHTKPKP